MDIQIRLIEKIRTLAQGDVDAKRPRDPLRHNIPAESFAEIAYDVAYERCVRASALDAIVCIADTCAPEPSVVEAAKRQIDTMLRVRPVGTGTPP